MISHKTKILSILCLLSTCLYARPLMANNDSLIPFAPKNNEKKIKLEIQSIFERNTKIWGTYRLTQEDIINPPHTRPLQSKNYLFPKETLIFKAGELTLISSMKNQAGLSKLWVKTFPYQRKDDEFYIPLEDHKESFWHLLMPRIDKMLTETNYRLTNLSTINLDQIHIDSMRCTLIKKKINCRIPIILMLAEDPFIL